MASKTWVAGTVIDSPWLQDVNDITYNLPLTTTGKGASLVGTEDSGGWFTGVNKTVEAMLQWLGSRVVHVVGTGGDDSAAFAAAITKAGIGGELRIYGTLGLPGGTTYSPLKRQRWVGMGAADFLVTGTTAVTAISFTTAGEFASITGIGFRATTGFTGVAFKFDASLNCYLEGALIRNVLNGIAVEFSGGSFYNQADNIKITSAGTALHITGTSPNCPNNNTINGIDIYGTVATGMLCDGNPSMFKLNDYIDEAATSVCKVKVTSNAGLIFDNPRFEQPSGTPSGGYYDIVSTAVVKFNGTIFRVQSAVYNCLGSDLFEYEKKKFFNLIQDPLFLSNFATVPSGWTVSGGTFSSITQTSTNTPGVSMVGNALECVASAAASTLTFTLNSAAAQALFRGKTLRAHCLSWFSSGTGIVVAAGHAGGAGGAKSTSTANLVASSWGVHTAEIAVASDATSISFTFQCVGNGSTFRLWAPVLEVDGSFYSFAYPTQEKPLHSNGYYVGTNANSVDYGTAAPATLTWKVGDRRFNSTPAVGTPKSWVCTVAGTPGTWVSEGNL